MTAGYCLVLLFIVGAVSGDGDGSWGYQTGHSFNSPDTWKNLPKSSCSGVRQSPVNIVTKQAQYLSALKPLVCDKGQASGNVLMKASATSYILYFGTTWRFSFSGTGCFQPVAIHWHWGSVDTQGSEHTIDGNRYAMEGHVVMFNCALYSNHTEATMYPSGLYAFSVLYSVGNTNPAIDKLIPFMATVRRSSNATIPEISPMEFLPKNLGSYYRYEGSLTTPPCTENVIWNVFTEIQSLSSTQISQLRLFQFGPPQSGPMVDNFRPTMSMDTSSDYIHRVVYLALGTRAGPTICVVHLFVLLPTLMDILFI